MKVFGRSSASRILMARARKQGRGKMLSRSKTVNAKNTQNNTKLQTKNTITKTTENKKLEAFEKVEKDAANLQSEITKVMTYCGELSKPEKATDQTKEQSEKKEDTTEKTRDNLRVELKKLVATYNALSEDLEQVDNTTCKIYGRHLKNIINEYEPDLKKLGISFSKKGKLELQETELQKADTTTLQNVLGKATGVLGKLKERGKEVEENAVTSIQVMNRLYGKSYNYNKYAGTNAGYYTGTNFYA